MSNKGNMTLRIEPELKEQAAVLFKSLGMDLSTATGIFYRQALRYQGLPFESVSESQTRQHMKQWKRLKKVKIYTVHLTVLMI